MISRAEQITHPMSIFINAIKAGNDELNPDPA
jgi:hypothetical protein